jgi:hypothetical protein
MAEAASPPRQALVAVASGGARPPEEAGHEEETRPAEARHAREGERRGAPRDGEKGADQAPPDDQASLTIQAIITARRAA